MATQNALIPVSQPKSTSKVTSETIQAAVTALLKWKTSKTNSEKPQLLPEDDFLYLILTLRKIPPKGGRTTPHKIPLPHPLLQESLSSEICLIIDDRHKSKITSEIAKKKVTSENIPVSKVLKFSKLKTDYKPFEAKRKLCDSYDLFFADKGIIPLLPKLLGKQFFKKKKLPLGVDLSHKNWKEQIERGCASALLYMKNGTCSVLKVGKVSMESGEIVENVAEAINGVVEFVPKKWEGVRSLHLKFSESVALPVYQTVPDMKLKIEGIRESVEDDGGSEVEVKEGGKKVGKVDKKGKKKKGRIHEVRYMDVGVGDNELGTDLDGDENVNNMIENGDLHSDEFVRKKKKKSGKMGKRGRGDFDDENENEGEKSENDDVVIAEVEVKKKKKKGEWMKGKVLKEKNEEKSAKKKSKKGDGEEPKKSLLAMKNVEESGGKKGKRKSNLGTTVENTTDKKAKKSKKKKQSAE